MLNFIKKLFGSKTSEPTPVPYKVEAPVAVVPPSTNVDSYFPVEKSKKKPAGEKKPAVRAKTARTKKSAGVSKQK